MPRSIVLLPLIYVLISTIAHPVNSLAEAIRKPVWAGRFYPADASDLKDLIGRLEHRAEKDLPALPNKATLRALIMPHAGYVYSGLTAAHCSRLLGKMDNRHIRKVIVMAPDHHIGHSSNVITDCTAYETPLGVVPVHPDVKKLLAGDSLFRTLPVSDTKEHAIEVILPFLQCHLADVQLIPIIMGAARVVDMADSLLPLLDKHTLIVASSDLSHYLSYEDAIAIDRDTISRILSSDIKGLEQDRNRACGLIPVLTLMRLSRIRGWTPILLNYTNSGDTSGVKDQVVGYTGIAYYQINEVNNDEK